MAYESGGQGRSTDLVLSPGEYAFVKDTTKGLVNVIVGPNKTSLSNTDQTVKWDDEARRFVNCSTEQAVQAYATAGEGQYIVLSNPVATGDEHPSDGRVTAATSLKVGRKVNLPGPATFPLWPGQSANIIDGHHIRSNQYLMVRVYNDEEAKRNWSQAVVRPQTQTQPQAPTEGATTETATTTAPETVALPDILTMGQQLVIKGTEVAFFIPPTGVEVIQDKETRSYVREAVTLERLEYCILLNEDGNKRYVTGPDVVFPEPTENFVTKDGQRKFRAIELNENSGIYVKVIAEYDNHKVGDELFITGKEQAIYFPREEHSIIQYGGQTKHYATAIPAGEGRYLLDRNTGEVRLVKGPKMLLPDPRKEVIVRRFLAEKTARLWYPGNEKVVQVNRDLAQQASDQPLTDYLKSDGARTATSATMANYLASASVTRSFKEELPVEQSFNRGTTYTPPRQITLDTKYEGAVSVNIWTGYAVLITSKTGKRRVVIGPETVLLEYDETLAPLELSTGTPKTDAKLMPTVYLRVENNKISDKIRVETQDLVPVELTLSYRVNFEGTTPDDRLRWFAVENYVRLLCDHMRSMVRNTAKRTEIGTFYKDAIDLVRDTVLGPAAENNKRPGRTFSENNMRIYDVEVLDVKIVDTDVATMMADAQEDALKAAMLIAKEERRLASARRIEAIRRDIDTEEATTARAKQGIEKEKIEAQIATNAERMRLEHASAIAEQERLDTIAEASNKRLAESNKIEREHREKMLAIEIKRLVGESDEIVKRAAAVNPALATALVTLSDNAMIERISKDLAPMSAVYGVSAADLLKQLFKGTAVEGVMDTLSTRTRPGIASATTR